MMSSLSWFLDAEDKPCSVSFLNKCDDGTTRCNDSKGFVECVCRPGFEKMNGSERKCKQQVFEKCKILQFRFNYHMINKVVECMLNIKRLESNIANIKIYCK